MLICLSFQRLGQRGVAQRGVRVALSQVPGQGRAQRRAGRVVRRGVVQGCLRRGHLLG
jgi:hypothetical protein